MPTDGSAPCQGESPHWLVLLHSLQLRAACLSRTCQRPGLQDGPGAAANCLLSALCSFASRGLSDIAWFGIIVSMMVAIMYWHEYRWTLVASLAVCLAALLWPVIRRHFVR